MRSLREAWDANAADWVGWSRSARHDHAFWRMNLPALLELLPPPAGPVLDVACGEGRVARALKARGYEVTGIEGSPALARAARELDPAFEVFVGDAASMPFEASSFELAICSLALMNMDDMAGVVEEIARVLRPEGRLCVSVLHPLSTWERCPAGSSYFQTVRYAETLERDGARLELHDTHRPLRDYLSALSAAGFDLERLLEPAPDDAYLAAVPEAIRGRERPGFLHLLAVRRS